MAFTTRRPTQHLNINCSDCGALTVKFESFVADGTVFEIVGKKLSEMMAFISASPDVVLCTACTAKAASEEQERRNRQRERIMQQMELPPTAPVVDPERPAIYPKSQPKLQRRETKGKAEQENRVVETAKHKPRRAFSGREKPTTSRYPVSTWHGMLTSI